MNTRNKTSLNQQDPNLQHYVPGLEGVVVGETAISHVEGELGRLSYRGRPIEQIVTMAYLDAACLVLFGGQGQSNDLQEYLTRHGQLQPGSDLKILRGIPGSIHPMKMLQAMLPVLQFSDEPFPGSNSQENHRDLSIGLQVMAKLPQLIAEIRAHRQPDHKAGIFDEQEAYLSRFLTMFNGEHPEPARLDIFKTVQLLQLDHSFNAGTFAARVISSTLAPVEAVLAGAVGALSGVLHGGADEAALRTAREVGLPENAADYVDRLVASKGRLMGMGHREYRTVDPRSVIIKPLAAALCRGSRYEQIFNTLQALEAAFESRMQARNNAGGGRPARPIRANLEFYKGVVYEALGIGPEYFTATFALSRAVGWLAHIVESRRTNRIIRPAAAYVGPAVANGS